MNNRVNGVLAVTRSLGDSSMKEFVVGSPYTTETTLGDEDDYLIIACDGVSIFPLSLIHAKERKDCYWESPLLMRCVDHQLWDVCEDQTAVDLIRDVKDAQEASQVLLEHALSVSNIPSRLIKEHNIDNHLFMQSYRTSQLTT